jgi:hypothetical protein
MNKMNKMNKIWKYIPIGLAGLRMDAPGW